MTEAEAIQRVTRMFLGHARAVSADIIAAYAEEVLEADCQSCMSEVLEQVRRDGQKVPPVSGLWSMYRDRNNSPAHLDHVGHDDHAVTVAEVETEWRTRGVSLIIAAGAPPDAAKVAAARMWACGAVPVDQAGEEWKLTIWRETNPDPSSKRIDAWWDYARAVATTPPAQMSEGEWNLLQLKLAEATA